MGNAVIDAVSNSRSLNENIIAVIVAKYSVRNAQARLVLCLNLASKKRFVLWNIELYSMDTSIDNIDSFDFDRFEYVKHVLQHYKSQAPVPNVAKVPMIYQPNI